MYHGTHTYRHAVTQAHSSTHPSPDPCQPSKYRVQPWRFSTFTSTAELNTGHEERRCIAVFSKPIWEENVGWVEEEQDGGRCWCHVMLGVMDNLTKTEGCASPKHSTQLFTVEANLSALWERMNNKVGCSNSYTEKHSPHIQQYTKIQASTYVKAQSFLLVL